VTVQYDLADIQGNILRGYGYPDARYQLLQIGGADGGRQLLSTLLTGAPDLPAVQDAAPWSTKPTACVNVFVTAPGLAALGVPSAALAAFPEAFTQGSAKRSASLPDKLAPWGMVAIGDIGESDPTKWEAGGPLNPVVHLVLAITSDEETSPARDAITAALDALYQQLSISVVTTYDGNTLPDGTVHFDYVDGIAQPQPEGSPFPRVADMQPDMKAGDLLLGRDYVNTYQGNYLGDIPSVLGDNGTYMAFRVLEQDCAAFHRFKALTAEQFDTTPDMIQAKMLGRWPDGTPLVMSPDDNNANVGADHLNEFDYASTLAHPTHYDDFDGLRCPFGAHIRRMNPRGAPVTGLQHNRRIVRRGVPYGPPFDPANPDDGERRGLLGAFISADLQAGFEFLMSVWANMDISQPGLRGTRDPVIGWQPPGGGRFEMPTGDSRGVLVTTNLPRLVTTKASLYLFVPGIGALNALAQGTW
jgi:deferrochelatase/peroxidase EfeB